MPGRCFGRSGSQAGLSPPASLRASIGMPLILHAAVLRRIGYTIASDQARHAPPAALDVACPAAPMPEAGDTWDSYKARVKATRDICQAALEAWRESWGECGE